MIGTLLTFLAMGIVSIVVVWIVLSVVGALLGLTLGIAGFLIFKVAPIMMVAWMCSSSRAGARARRRLTADRKCWGE